MNKGQKVKVFQVSSNQWVKGTVFDIEEKKGFRGRKYNTIHVQLGEFVEKYNEWDVVEL